MASKQDKSRYQKNNWGLIHIYYSNEEIFQNPPHSLSQYSLKSFIGWTIEMKCTCRECDVHWRKNFVILNNFDAVLGHTYLSRKNEGGRNGYVSSEMPSALALACLYTSLLFTVKQCRTNEQMQKQSWDVKTSDDELAMAEITIV